ncbi:MAG: riboflavin synthase [Planctomycetota bacterium]
MFTGIVETIGTVVRCTEAGQRGSSTAAHRLEVRLGDLLDTLESGASVALNGVCLTLADRQGDIGGFDVVPETWRNTNLHVLRSGARVNVERALAVGDRIDGHFVQGHIDALGKVERVERAAREWKLWIEVAPDVMPYIVRKGSITLDGTSLTVVDAGQRNFSVVLIPTTLERTILKQRGPGDLVNVETDILARIVLSKLAALGLDQPGAGHGATGLTIDHLRESGFV